MANKTTILLFILATLVFFLVPVTSYGVVVNSDSGTLVHNEFFSDGTVDGDPNRDDALGSSDDEE